MEASVNRADFHSGNLFNNPQSLVNEKIDPKAIRATILTQNPSDRCEYARKVSINVDGYRISVEFIENLIQRSKRTDRPGGFWLIGDGGTGKSYILKSTHNKYKPVESDEDRYCPLVYLPFSSRPSKADLYLTILLQLGQDPTLISYKSVEDLEKIGIDALKQSGTLAILFDEAHHLWLSTSASRRLDRFGGIVGDTIKTLYDSAGVALIFSGTPGLEEVFNKDKQANTRWAGIYRLEEFQFDEKFIGLLEALDEALPMHEKAEFAKYFAEKLFVACKANFRILKNILAEAVFLAASKNSKKITREHLERAYFLVTCSQDNPFAKQ